MLIGTSVHAHLRAVRLAAAMAMLGSGRSMTETAYAVGYSSLSHFSKAFRDHAGASPCDWAKRCSGDD
ncbi:helix-turn-helix domain-containing protein [Rhodospira trueperi]|uniref:Helix-turn-helix domain-containing protein n=1 Tax=Rhodospira trueperi TaxID=69960 RepID=A0A1G7EPL2_9PROT|nr:helix-turn-helix domain-containing protein [Rhodospira trueperi]SDE65325.1 Helix-turn-helix domain-containing protein [Rhodospira trueperi]